MEGMSKSSGPNLYQISQLDQQSEAAKLSPWNEDFYGRSNSDASMFSEVTDDTSSFASESPSPSHWLGYGMQSPHILTRLSKHMHKKDMDDQELEEALMKERFARLMLGGDMSGSGHGECPAKAVSNAIANLYSSTLGTYDKLEPLYLDHRANWMREMNFLSAPCDHIVELVPGIQEQEDGKFIEVSKPVPRSDMANISTLRLLDSCLLDTMTSFEGTDLEIKYAVAAHDGSSNRNTDKWWHPIPLLPEGGLSEKSRRLLRKKHNIGNQVFKAARLLNYQALADMDIPESYIEPLPKTGKAVLGDVVYRYLTSSAKFKPEELVGYLNFASEEEARETLEKLESAMVIWRRKASSNEGQSKSSWMVMKDDKKNADLAKRAEETVYYLKQKYHKLSQTSLDVSKLDCNTDVGKAILEGYSRVLESWASRILTMIDEILVSDKNMRTQVTQQ